MNKFVLRVVCTGKEAKIEWENAQQLQADSLWKPLVRGKRRKSADWKRERAPFCILSEA
jgi:hypothetical protein